MSNPYSGAIIGLGTTLGYAAVDANDAPSGAYTVLASIIDAEPPEQTVGKADGTNYSSPDDAEEYIPGLIAGGEAKFTLFYKTASAAIIQGLLRQTKAWQITFPDGHTYTWVGWLSKLGTKIPVKEGIKQECSLQPISANSIVYS
jgi:hypothetical protein